MKSFFERHPNGVKKYLYASAAVVAIIFALFFYASKSNGDQFFVSFLVALVVSIGVAVMAAAAGIILVLILSIVENASEKTVRGIKENEKTSAIPPVAGPSANHSLSIPSAPPAKPKLVKEDFVVVGVPYYKENIMKLACANPDWKKHTKTLLAENKDQVFRYSFINKPVKLIPEPSNEHDSNAILVQIAGEKVGYISREENIHVKDILDNRSVKYVSSFISGGDCKLIFENGSMEKVTKEIGINIRIAYS